MKGYELEFQSAIEVKSEIVDFTFELLVNERLRSDSSSNSLELRLIIVSRVLSIVNPIRVEREISITKESRGQESFDVPEDDLRS